METAEVKISHKVTVTKNITVNKLFILPGAKLTISENITLKVLDRLVREEGSEIINNGYIEVGK